jgi:hypothetical protein
MQFQKIRAYHGENGEQDLTVALYGEDKIQFPDALSARLFLESIAMYEVCNAQVGVLLSADKSGEISFLAILKGLISVSNKARRCLVKIRRAYDYVNAGNGGSLKGEAE